MRRPKHAFATILLGLQSPAVLLMEPFNFKEPREKAGLMVAEFRYWYWLVQWLLCRILVEICPCYHAVAGDGVQWCPPPVGALARLCVQFSDLYIGICFNVPFLVWKTSGSLTGPFLSAGKVLRYLYENGFLFLNVGSVFYCLRTFLSVENHS
jgi:hypothetical protein